MLQVEMSASVRNVSGKGPMRQLRMQGKTPAVVYGSGAEAQMLQLDTKTLMAKLLQFYRYNTIVTLKVDGGTAKSVMVGEVQTDPEKDTLIHVDFCEIDLGKDRAFNVPVTYEGTPKGVDLGGQLNVIYPEIVLEGKPLDIPDDIVVDIKHLEIGDSLKCGDFSVPDAVKMVTDPAVVAVAILKEGIKIEDEEEEAEVQAEEVTEE